MFDRYCIFMKTNNHEKWKMGSYDLLKSSTMNASKLSYIQALKWCNEFRSYRKIHPILSVHHVESTSSPLKWARKCLNETGKLIKSDRLKRWSGLTTAEVERMAQDRQDWRGRVDRVTAGPMQAAPSVTRLIDRLWERTFKHRYSTAHPHCNRVSGTSFNKIHKYIASKWYETWHSRNSAYRVLICNENTGHLPLCHHFCQQLRSTRCQPIVQ